MNKCDKCGNEFPAYIRLDSDKNTGETLCGACIGRPQEICGKCGKAVGTFDWLNFVCDDCYKNLCPPEHLAQLAEYRKMVILTLDGDDTRLSKYEVLARLLPDDEDKPDTGKRFADWLTDVNKVVWVIALFFAAFVGFLHLMNWLGF